MLTRQEYENLECKILAPYACKSAESRGREYPEKEHAYRTAFQRDRDRIIHSSAFRRLEYKTQVFIYHEGDHYRTRLTHTLEGSQIARTMARALRLNEELAEAIMLAHDLGHTPFGHSGQDVMNHLMSEHGGFEHNRQSLRIVCLLEKRYPKFPGLNLTYEVREGIAKHATSYDLPQVKFGRSGQPSLEGQIADVADEIAYNSHDLDDGLYSGLINVEQLKSVTLWKEYYEKTRSDCATDENVHVRQTIKAILNALVTDLVRTTGSNIEEMGIRNFQDVRNANRKCVGFSKEMEQASKELKTFLYENLYKHFRVERMAEKAKNIIEGLFRAYCKNPKILPLDISQKIGETPVDRVVCDYIAGMTDRFALEEHARLFDPRVKV
jgi:dGTPase